MKSHLLTLASLFILLGFTACSTPESRIKKNPEVFNSFSPEVQAKIRAGEIEMGYTKDAVRIALDRSDRTYTRSSAAGTVEVWSYVETQLSYDRQRVRGTFQVKDGDGRIRTVHDDVWVTVENRTEYEAIRVEFGSDGLVSAIERTKR